MSPSIAVIIPSLNSPIIDRVLAAVLNQKNTDALDEIIVIGKDDAGLISDFRQVKFIDTGIPIKASEARNLGIQESTSELLIFLDSDCVPSTDWCNEHTTAHAAGNPVVGGGVLPVGKNYWNLVYNLTLFHEFLSFTQPGPRDYLPSLNLSVERGVIQEVGSMDEEINRVEDIDWTTRMRRAGYQPYFWPSASVNHQHNRTNLKIVWRDCALSGYHMRWLRLHYNNMLQAPGILRYRYLILLLSPMIAVWATFRIILKEPTIVLRYWSTLPGIYLTKIAWCWGASRPNPSS